MSTPHPHVPWDDRFEQILRGPLSLMAPDAPLAADASLPALGLDSLQTVTLLVELEEVYAITFPDEALNADTFATAGNLWNQVVACGAVLPAVPEGGTA